MLKVVQVSLVVIGVFIIAGFVFIAVELYNRATDPDYRVLAENPVPTKPLITALELGPTASVASVVATSSRIAVLVRGLEGGDRVYLLDPVRAAVTGVIGADTLPADLAG